MKTNSILFPFLLSTLVAGCVVGPDYKSPAVNAPTCWKEPLLGGESNDSPPVTAWWKTFKDPELDSLVQRAVKSNPDLQIAAARVREERAKYGVVAANLAPVADTAASYARTESSHNQPVLGSLPIPADIPFQNDVYQTGFDASWELDVFGGTHRAVEAAKAEVAGSEFGRRATLMTLLGDVARNYIEARTFQRRLAVTNENIEVQTQALTITRDRFSNGLTSDLDVQQASTLLATTKAEIPTLKTAIRASIHRLDVLLGQQPGTLLAELSNPAPIPTVPPVVPVGLSSELLLHRPDVQRAERQFAAATANIGVAKADLFPKFSLNGSAGFQSINAGDWFSRGSSFWSVGPTVQWRLFDAGRIRANIRVQNARQQQALSTYEKTMLTAFEEVENGLVAYANEQVRHASLEEAVNSSRNSLNLANKLYANGLVDFLHVLDAERSLYQTQDALVQSECNVSINLVSLYKSLGGGWEAAEMESSPGLSK